MIIGKNMEKNIQKNLKVVKFETQGQSWKEFWTKHVRSTNLIEAMLGVL